MQAPETNVERIAHDTIRRLLGNNSSSDTVIQESVTQSLSEEEKAAELNSRERLARLQEKRLNQCIRQTEQEHKLRTKFTPRIFWLVVGMLAGTFLLFVVSGILNACGRVFLSDKVLMALLGTTVADVIGLLVFALKWLYPNRS